VLVEIEHWYGYKRDQKVDKKIIKLSLDSILYIESLKDYIRVKTRHDDYITYCTLSNFTSQLPSQNFIRAHRSYTVAITVAIDKIEQIDGNFALIAGNYIPLFRNMKLKVMERFLQ
jgi:DNA-binding LytR/AlgR family response regulator